MKWPNRLDGMQIKTYFRLRFTTLNLKLGTAFFILLKFNRLITVIDKKNETVIEFIPIKGVNNIKLANNTKEPTM